VKKHDENLFQIGEVTKILGVTRKALLIYEEMGLLTPAVKDAESGYRYYSADNMTHIRSIKSLQSIGLTLKEVANYYDDTHNIDGLLARLIELRADIDRQILQMQIRAAKLGDLTVRRTSLPQQVCFCREYQCGDISDASNKLRETYVAAARTEKMCRHNRMFTMRLSLPGEPLKLMCCVPVDGSFEGPERMEFDETPALCIYYRGPYEGTANAMRTLIEYIRENNIETAGHFRCIYLEGPPNRGEKSGDYITQVAVPIKE